MALVRQLNELDKIHLVLALQEVTKKASRHKEATQYIDDLVKAVQLPVNKQHSKLTRWVARAGAAGPGGAAGGSCAGTPSAACLCPFKRVACQIALRACLLAGAALAVVVIAGPQHACARFPACRQQIERAVSYQRSLQKFSAVSEEEPSWRQLAAIGIASGLPFVVFGFLDNGIMLVAGEQIDAVFGARFGLTTLASAGLGNLVADVVGVSATHSVQDLLKRTGWVRPPPLRSVGTPARRLLTGGPPAGAAAVCLAGAGCECARRAASRAASRRSWVPRAAQQRHACAEHLSLLFRAPAACSSSSTRK